MRVIVIYTPNYLIQPYEIVWDSSDSSVGLEGVNFGSFYEVAAYYKALDAEDYDIEVFDLLNNQDPQEFLRVYNHVCPLATDNDMWWSDVGVIARKVVDNCERCSEEYDKKLDELEEEYKASNQYFHIKRWRKSKK